MPFYFDTHLAIAEAAKSASAWYPCPHSLGQVSPRGNGYALAWRCVR